jgi:alpha-galactosidase
MLWSLKAKMDVSGTLAVRFHLNGEFITSQKCLFYCGVKEKMSYIDLDKVSLQEIYGHLKDHCSVHEGATNCGLLCAIGRDANN